MRLGLQSGERQDERFGMRLLTRDIISAEHDVEQTHEARRFELVLDSGAMRARHDAYAMSARQQIAHHGSYSWNDRGIDRAKVASPQCVGARPIVFGDPEL